MIWILKGHWWQWRGPDPLIGDKRVDAIHGFMCLTKKKLESSNTTIHYMFYVVCEGDDMLDPSLRNWYLWLRRTLEIWIIGCSLMTYILLTILCVSLQHLIAVDRTCISCDLACHDTFIEPDYISFTQKLMQHLHHDVQLSMINIEHHLNIQKPT